MFWLFPLIVDSVCTLVPKDCVFHSILESPTSNAAIESFSF